MNVRQVEHLSELVSRFGEAMRRKLWKKLREGYAGWDDDSDPDVAVILRDKLDAHVKRYLAGDPSQLVDVANLAAMLWRIEVDGDALADRGGRGEGGGAFP